jgi:hypothetical protein
MSHQIDNGREVLETIRDHGWCAVHVRAMGVQKTAQKSSDGDHKSSETPRIIQASPSTRSELSKSDGYRPGYAYSVGFGLTRETPEAAVFGLALETARAALWRLWDLELGRQGFTDGEKLDGVLPNRSVMLRRISAARYDAYFGTALKTYASLCEFGRLRMMQVVYPDDAGRYPWEPQADYRFQRAQPALYAPILPSGHL